VLGSTDLILPEDLPETILETGVAGNSGADPAGFHEGVKLAKGRLISDALERAGGSHVEAARLLGLHPTYLSRLIRNLKPVL
jgi:transcriptional regulator with GAF, ATPase, and Fis domain